MKCKIMTLALLSTLAVASIAAPSFAQGPDHTPPPIGLLLASNLSAAQTYIGVTPEQFPAWQAYASALIALAEASGPGFGGPGFGELGFDGPGPRPFGEPGQERKPGDIAGKPVPLFSERLASRGAGLTEKAKALQAAIEGLRSTLDPDQFLRLAEAERSFAPGGHPPFHGRGERHDQPD